MKDMNFLIYSLHWRHELITTEATLVILFEDPQAIHIQISIWIYRTQRDWSSSFLVNNILPGSKSLLVVGPSGFSFRWSIDGFGKRMREITIKTSHSSDIVVELSYQTNVSSQVICLFGLMVLIDLVDEKPVWSKMSWTWTKLFWKLCNTFPSIWYLSPNPENTSPSILDSIKLRSFDLFLFLWLNSIFQLLISHIRFQLFQ